MTSVWKNISMGAFLPISARVYDKAWDQITHKLQNLMLIQARIHEQVNEQKIER